VPHAIETVVDMRDELSTLGRTAVASQNAHVSNERESAI
jgi:hypothetical protein